jgi:predicted TPR repeat methyltransferase
LAALAPPPQAELSLDEAQQLAVRLHRDGRLEAARTLYQRILQAAPGHVDAAGMLGVVEHQLGNSDAGLALLRQVVRQCPDVPGLHLNLGNVLVETDHLDEALHAFMRAAALDPGSADIHNNIGAVHRAQDRFDQALAAYHQAIRLDPNNGRAWNNLGLLHDARGDLERATHAYLTAIELMPGQGLSASLLGMTFYKLKKIDKATEVFRQWVIREPANPVPAHLYAACTGTNVPKRASDQYVEAEFDSFAASFERVLNDRLRYRAPQLCADLLAATLGPAAGTLEVLDAGCGTGLCGPLVAPWARRLVGVDLSAGMLGRARSKGVYSELVKSELTAYLTESQDCWDAIICADTLCYFGDLADVMQAAAASLRPGGVMVYTVEALPDDQAVLAQILPNGRYAHGRAHLDVVTTAAGLITRDARRDVLRDEAGAEVQGWLLAVQRPA